jgi:hypothetical protein
MSADLIRVDPPDPRHPRSILLSQARMILPLQAAMR